MTVGLVMLHKQPKILQKLGESCMSSYSNKEIIKQQRDSVTHHGLYTPLPVLHSIRLRPLFSYVQTNIRDLCRAKTTCQRLHNKRVIYQLWTEYEQRGGCPGPQSYSSCSRLKMPWSTGYQLSGNPPKSTRDVLTRSLSDIT